jgi:hypothetical protein
MGNAFPPDKQGRRPEQFQAPDRSPRPQLAEKKRCPRSRVIEYAVASPIATGFRSPVPDVRRASFFPLNAARRTIVRVAGHYRRVGGGPERKPPCNGQ